MDAKREQKRSPWQARTMLVNEQTGEIKDAPEGIPAFIQVRHRAGRHIAVLCEALEAIAMDRDLTVNDHRVLRVIDARCEYANVTEGHPDAYVRIVQAELARQLGTDRANVNRAIKKLIERKIILRMAPRGQAAQYFALNPNYGWRGGHGAWKKRRADAPKLQLVRGGKTIEKTSEKEPTIYEIFEEMDAPKLIDLPPI